MHRTGTVVLDAPAPPVVSEKTLVGLIGAVQFVNILDFMMVMPLGPDFAKALDIPTSRLGLIGGSYTAAAAVAGIAGAFFLDRFDRKKALLVSLVGLACGTFLGALATGLGSLLFARVVAGMFGGPATSVSLSIIADVIPVERRGRAMGAVMGAFSVASVLGVPAGLELAEIGSWRLPFLGVGAAGAAVVVLGFFALPSLRGHLASSRGPPRLLRLFFRRINLLAYAALALAMMSGFALIPNIAAHLEQNLHYPRAELGRLYLVGGALSFVVMQVTGRIVDRVGSFAVNTAGTVGFAVAVWLGFVLVVPPVPVLVLFCAFMLSQTTRNVSMTTLMTKVPEPHERAGFLSVQSATRHMASAVGAAASSQVLSDGPGGSLLGVPALATASIVLAALAPPFVFVVERAVRRRAS